MPSWVQKRKSYTPKYRREAAHLVIGTGRPIAEVARDIGVGAALLGRWVPIERSRMDDPPEAMDADGNLFGKARLVDAVRHASPAGARDLIDAILAAVRAYVGDTPQADDLTIVTVKRN